MSSRRTHLGLPDLGDEDTDFLSTLGRTRRPVADEWDDYTVLYADIGTALIQAIEDDLLEPDPEPLVCPLCEYHSPTFRGLTVHLSRTHDIKSARADYFASRKEA